MGKECKKLDRNQIQNHGGLFSCGFAGWRAWEEGRKICWKLDLGERQKSGNTKAFGLRNWNNRDGGYWKGSWFEEWKLGEEGFPHITLRLRGIQRKMLAVAYLILVFWKLVKTGEINLGSPVWMQYYIKGRDVGKKRRDVKAKPCRIPSYRGQNSVHE